MQHYHRRKVVSRSCSGWEGVGPTCYGHQALTCRGRVLVNVALNLESVSSGGIETTWVMKLCINERSTHFLFSITCQGYRDKPYGQLVLVSLMHYCTSTPSLSTSWSRTTLQRAQGSGKSHLKASFPLRCFQRLSLPNLATRQCHWRDNRYTRGSSTPVLSY